MQSLGAPSSPRNLSVHKSAGVGIHNICDVLAVDAFHTFQAIAEQALLVSPSAVISATSASSSASATSGNAQFARLLAPVFASWSALSPPCAVDLIGMILKWRSTRLTLVFQTNQVQNAIQLTNEGLRSYYAVEYLAAKGVQTAVESLGEEQPSEALLKSLDCIRKTVFDYFTAASEVLGKPRGIGEAIVQKFKGSSPPEATFANALEEVPEFDRSSRAWSVVIGQISQLKWINFKTFGTTFLDVQPFLISEGLRFSFSVEDTEEGAQRNVWLVETLLQSFIKAKGLPIAKHAIAKTLANIFFHVGSHREFTVNMAKWNDLIRHAYNSMFDWSTKAKHQIVGFPLLASILCAADRTFFTDNFGTLLDIILLGCTDPKLRLTGLTCVQHLLQTFFLHSSASGNVITLSHVMKVCEVVFFDQSLKKLCMLEGMQLLEHDVILSILLTICVGDVKFAMDSIILRLLADASQSSLLGELEHFQFEEKALLAVRALTALFERESFGASNSQTDLDMRDDEPACNIFLGVYGSKKDLHDATSVESAVRNIQQLLQSVDDIATHPLFEPYMVQLSEINGSMLNYCNRSICAKPTAQGVIIHRFVVNLMQFIWPSTTKFSSAESFEFLLNALIHPNTGVKQASARVLSWMKKIQVTMLPDLAQSICQKVLLGGYQMSSNIRTVFVDEVSHLFFNTPF
jgi:hypothetical protein